jgi:hypothetical protein
MLPRRLDRLARYLINDQIPDEWRRENGAQSLISSVRPLSRFEPDTWAALIADFFRVRSHGKVAIRSQSVADRQIIVSPVKRGMAA